MSQDDRRPPRAPLAVVARIAVVGGSGFIGRRLAALLRRGGHEVTIVDLVPAGGGAAFRQADVRDRAGLTAALQGAEAVFNLAAVHRDDVKPVTRYDEVNAAGAANVCGACRELGIARLIFTSTAAVYGVTAPPEAAEEHPPAPFNAYGASKLRAEEVHRDWQAEAPAARSLVTVRPTAVFGEGNRGNVYNLMRQLSAGRFVMVGNGRNRKSIAYVDNVSAFLAAALEFGPGSHLFNYADKPDLTTRELVETLLRVLGRTPRAGVRVPYAVGYLGGLACDLAAALTGAKLPVSAVRVKKFCSTTTFSTARVEAAGFQPPYSLREALERTVRHEISPRAGGPPAGGGGGGGGGGVDLEYVAEPHLAVVDQRQLQLRLRGS